MAWKGKATDPTTSEEVQDEALPGFLDDGRFEVYKSQPAGTNIAKKTFVAVDLETKVEVVAKFEYLDQPPFSLAHEARVLKELNMWEKSTGNPRAYQGIIRMFHYGAEGTYDCLVIEQTGRSLEALQHICKGKFTLHTVVLLGLQILHLIEYMHGKGFIHRNICPASFVMGVNDKVHHVYLTGVECAERWWKHKPFKNGHVSPVKNGHVRKTSGHELIGNPLFSSFRSHTGVSMSRRDDLESVGHMLLYFLRGDLPWSPLRKKYEIGIKKAETPIEELCAPIRLSEPFEIYMHYARGLHFAQRPEYENLSSLLQEVRDSKPIRDHDLDWLLNYDIEPEQLEPIDYNLGIMHPDRAMYYPRAGFCLCGRHPAWSDND